MLITPQSPQKVVAVETSVVDLLYPTQHDDAGLKHLFISQLPDLAKQVEFEGIEAAPRKGDMVMVSAEALDEMLVAFCDKVSNEGVSSFASIKDEQDAQKKAEGVRRVLFGEPTMHAGGSLANSFDAMVYSQISGVATYDGKFVCMTGADETGRFFIDSFSGHIASKSSGRQMVSHIIPVDGDRIMLTAPSFADSPDSNFDTGRFSKTLNEEKPDLIMVGGYLQFAKPGTLTDVIEIAEEYRRSVQKTPTLAFTLASQIIADALDLDTFDKNNGPLVIHGNTGEFRRFMGMDNDWREPFEHYFRTGKDAELQGRELELVKTQLYTYQDAKQRANEEASIAAFEMAQERDVSFVITNSTRPAFVVSSDGIFKRPTPPLGQGRKVRNTVGAGDNFVGGFWVGQQVMDSVLGSIAMGQMFSKAVVVQDEARLKRDATDVSVEECNSRLTGPLAHASGMS
ncbi:MAG: PfkB family carbohydrate kinase [Pseudomonadota bacterium]